MRDGNIALYIEEIPMAPGACLSINATCHHMARNQQAQELRQAARLATVDAIARVGRNPVPAKGDLGLQWTIWLGRGQRMADTDNAISRVKSAQDGIFDALGTNDRRVKQIAVKQVRDPDGRGWMQCAVVALEGAA